ncbi:MAG: hypothetical protein ACRCXH_09555 [Shewanella sp.]
MPFIFNVSLPMLMTNANKRGTIIAPALSRPMNANTFTGLLIVQKR